MAIPQFMRGRNLTSVILTGQTIGTAGAPSDGTAYTLTTQMDGLSDSLQAVTENISAVNSSRANNMVIEDDFSITLRILKINDSGDPNKLRTAAQLYDYFKLTWVEGTGASARTHVARCTRGALESGIEGKGKQIASLTLLQADFDTATFVVT